MSTATSTPKLTVYLAPGCHLCHDALAVLHELQTELGFDLEECDITREDALHRAYLERIPVVTMNGDELFEYFVDPDVLRECLKAERSVEIAHESAGDPGHAGPPR